MVEFVKSNEERWIDAVTEIVTALLASQGNSLYPAHARDIMPSVDVLLEKAREDGNQRIVKSLEHSKQLLANMAPRG